MSIHIIKKPVQKNKKNETKNPRTCDFCGRSYRSAEAKFYNTPKGKKWLCKCEDCLGYRIKTGEFIPDRIKEERTQFFNSIVQPFRSGELSKEFVDAHPGVIEDMKAEGNITDKDVAGAKNVWKDLEGWSNRDRSQ